MAEKGYFSNRWGTEVLVTDKYVFFWRSKIFAQWGYSSFIDSEGISYNCAEQYMMAKKAELFNDFEIQTKIMAIRPKQGDPWSTLYPKEQQKLGRLITGFDDKKWSNIREDIVFNGNMLKFTQNKELQQELLATEHRLLVEASPVDQIWGCGMGIENKNILNPKNWTGLNLLGKNLTKVRDIIYSHA